MDIGQEGEATRILVIDDQPSIHEDFRKILQSGGIDEIDAAAAALFGTPAATLDAAPTYAVDSAHQGREGLAMVEEALRRGRPYPLAFVDVRMPPGWDGVETIRHIWQVDPDILIVICTAYSDQTWEEIVQELGRTDQFLILKKPFDVIEVRQLTASLATRWRLARQAALKLEELETMVAARTRALEEAAAEQRRANEALERFSRRLDGLNRLQKELLLPGPLAGKLKKITEAAVELLDLDFCRIWLLRQGDLCNTGCIHAAATDKEHLCRRRERCLHLAASSGRYTHIDGDHRRVPYGMYKIGLIANGAESKFICNEVTAEPRVHNHEWAKSLGLVSFAGYKLRDQRNNTTGVFAMFAQHAVSEEDDAFLANLAETASKVIIDYLAEEELRQSQKLEGIGQLAGGIAHEFNNLLQVIGGYAACALDGLDSQEPRYDDLQQVIKASQRASTLTRQLLGFSRRRAMELKATDANSLVRDLAELVRPAIGEHVTVDFALDARAGTVIADEGELQQALLNLCLNARDAMWAPAEGRYGGALRLKTERVFLSEPCWDPQFEIKSGPYVVFSVSDTGCGIPRDVQERVFEPFFTTKEVGKGTGLGLAQVYGVIRQHQGAIHLYSEPGLGTTFKLYLPAGREEAEERLPEELQKGPRGNETILVAEDEPMVRNLSVRALEGAGYSVLTAADGEEAMRVFDENRDAVSLAVLDVIMPKRTGHQVCDHIKQVSPSVPIVFCTGYDPDMARSQQAVDELVPLVQKPFTAQTLLAVVRKALDARPHYKRPPSSSPSVDNRACYRNIPGAFAAR